MSKIHLLSSIDPLKEHVGHTAACGKLVPNAEFKFFFEGELPTNLWEAISSITTCRKCLAADLTGKYVYGIADGRMLEPGEIANARN